MNKGNTESSLNVAESIQRSVEATLPKRVVEYLKHKDIDVVAYKQFHQDFLANVEKEPFAAAVRDAANQWRQNMARDASSSNVHDDSDPLGDAVKNEMCYSPYIENAIDTALEKHTGLKMDYPKIMHALQLEMEAKVLNNPGGLLPEVHALLAAKGVDEKAYIALKDQVHTPLNHIVYDVMREVKESTISNYSNNDIQKKIRTQFENTYLEGHPELLKTQPEEKREAYMDTLFMDAALELRKDVENAASNRLPLFPPPPPKPVRAEKRAALDKALQQFQEEGAELGSNVALPALAKKNTLAI